MACGACSGAAPGTPCSTENYSVGTCAPTGECARVANFEATKVAQIGPDTFSSFGQCASTVAVPYPPPPNAASDCAALSKWALEQAGGSPEAKGQHFVLCNPPRSAPSCNACAEGSAIVASPEYNGAAYCSVYEFTPFCGADVCPACQSIPARAGAAECESCEVQCRGLNDSCQSSSLCNSGYCANMQPPGEGVCKTPEGATCVETEDCEETHWCNFDNAYAPRTCQPRSNGACYNLGGGDRCTSGLCHIDYTLGSNPRLGYEGRCVDECPQGTVFDAANGICWRDTSMPFCGVDVCPACQSIPASAGEAECESCALQCRGLNDSCQSSSLCNSGYCANMQPPGEGVCKTPEGANCVETEDCAETHWCNFDNAFATASCQPRSNGACYHLGGGERCITGVCFIDVLSGLGSHPRLGLEGRCADTCPEGTTWDEAFSICWRRTDEDVRMRTCRACASVPVTEACSIVGVHTSAEEDRTDCYVLGDEFLDGKLAAGDYCDTGFAADDRDCADASSCRRSFTCVNPIQKCPPRSFVAHFPVHVFDHCRCSLGFAPEYSADTGSFLCLETEEEQQYYCPANSYIKVGVFPPQRFEDCSCDFNYARGDITAAACVNRNSMTPPVASYECPDHAYISSDRWPIEDFTSDCSCSWGRVLSAGECVLPPTLASTRARKVFVVEFADTVACGQVLKEAPSIVASVARTLPSASASAVYVAGSSCESPASNIMGSSRRRRRGLEGDGAAHFITVAVEEEKALSEASAEAIASALVLSGFHLSGVALEPSDPSSSGDDEDDGSSEPLQLVVGVTVAAGLCVGLLVAIAAFVAYRRRQQHDAEKHDFGVRCSQVEMQNNVDQV